jgi:hypothetical protein
MAQAVVKRLPIVFTDVRAGHELINLNYLLDHGVGCYARIPREVLFMVEQILDGKMHFDFEKAYISIVKPQDSTTIIQAIDSINPEDQAVLVKNYQEN